MRDILPGFYNPNNRWNTSCGIAHLCAPDNVLRAQIKLAARATRVYQIARNRIVGNPELIVASDQDLGNPNRNSDVAIVGAVNALARQGRKIALANPVGIYIHDIDLAGWEFPEGIQAKHCIHWVRGVKGRGMRLVIDMPCPHLSLSDVSIGGEPIRYGGQIAECITMKLTALAGPPREIPAARVDLRATSFVLSEGGSELFKSSEDNGLPPPPGAIAAFQHEFSPGNFPPQCRLAIGEPLLALDQIQGLALPGFLKPHQTLLCVRHGRDAVSIRKVKSLLAHLACEISWGQETMQDRHRFRQGGLRRSNPLLGLAFTWPGLCCLTKDAEQIQSPAFRLGLARRSALLGDPITPGQPGHPSTWVVGGPQDVLDFMLVIAGDSRVQVNQRASELLTQLHADGCRVHRQNGDKLYRRGPSREHFGFADGISQPGIRGRWNPDDPQGAPTHFITPESIAEWPASGLYGRPGQALVWPGEFVLGYAKTGPDPKLPGPTDPLDLPWMKDGAYLVYSRLQQNVGLFWQTMREQAAALSQLSGFEGISAEALASRLVGRTRSGAPLSRLQGLPRHHQEWLGRNPNTNNDFRYDADTPTSRLHPKVNPPSGWTRWLNWAQPTPPAAKADPLGQVCPVGAHIRRLNPRDSASDVGGESATLQHHILRTSLPFGPPREPLTAPPREGEPERGLQFLCIQASIEAQFEFLQARWMNAPARPKSSGGADVLAGRQPSESSGLRGCTLLGTQGQAYTIRTGQPFVTSSGGAYFFVPSKDAINDVLVKPLSDAQ